MGMYKYVREMWNKPQQNPLWRERLIQWRKDNSTVRLEHPTRIDRARSLGYKAKQGLVVVRQRVRRGGHRREKISGGRRSKRFGKRLDLKKSYQVIAEERAQRKFRNLSVLNSYWVADDGSYSWYEIILLDPEHPVVKSDPHLSWISLRKNKSRVFHGKTSAGKKSRGLTR